MSEAELHIIRARLDGGICNKAARGELRRGLPVGFVWGEQDGEVLFHPDEAVTGAVRTVFERFAEFGSARRVWLWFRSEGLLFPLHIMPAGLPGPVRWVTPTYTALHHILTNPVYAGAYTYGKTKYQRYVDEHGAVRKRTRHLPMDQWAVLIADHHPGYIDWATFEANQARLDSNTRPRPHQSGGAVREGAALLQGLATCGHCGRRLHVHYRGRNSAPGYHCCGKDLVNGRGVYGLNGAWKWNAHASKRNGPSAAIAVWIPRTGSSHAVWKPNGRHGCAPWRMPKRNCANASSSAPL